MHIRLQRKLSLGVDAHTIIEKHNKRFWSNYSFGDKKSRDAFLSMKEVTNLREASKRRKNDVTSVEMLKEEIDEISKKHNHASYIRFYKRNTDMYCKTSTSTEPRPPAKGLLFAGSDYDPFRSQGFLELEKPWPTKTFHEK